MRTIKVGVIDTEVYPSEWFFSKVWQILDEAPEVCHAAGIAEPGKMLMIMGTSTHPSDSWCGQFMITSALRRRGLAFEHLPTCFPEEPVFAEGVASFVRACAAQRNFHEAGASEGTAILGTSLSRCDRTRPPRRGTSKLLRRSRAGLLKPNATTRRRRVRYPLSCATQVPVSGIQCSGPARGRDHVPPTVAVPSVVTPAGNRREVFVAYCDREVADALKLKHLLEVRLSLEAVLLDDKCLGSATLMEALERRAASATAAIVIMTPDDRVVTQDGGEYYQPRPNVTFEQGWLYAKLGRDRVLTMVKEGTTLHSDVLGIHHLRFVHSVMEKSEGIRDFLWAVVSGLSAQ